MWIELADAPLIVSLPVQVTVSREKVTWHGAIIKKPGEGMPNYDNNNQRGSLYITVEVDFPKKTFSAEEKEGGRDYVGVVQLWCVSWIDQCMGTHTHTHTLS